ncbi:hypothetical protein LH401_08970 [Fusobacterium ulcerans]
MISKKNYIKIKRNICNINYSFAFWKGKYMENNDKNTLKKDIIEAIEVIFEILEDFK